MNIGITYDLRRDYLEKGFSEEATAEFDSEETIGAIHDAIRGLGHSAVLIGSIYELTGRLAAGERWDLVFNIAEGLFGRSREAQVPALLEAYGIPCTFSDPLTLAVCLDKAMTKVVVRDAGVPTPDFMVVTSPGEAAGGLTGKNMAFPVFVKPLSEGTSKGISNESIVVDRESLKRMCSLMLVQYGQPVLVEGYLPGREFTVGITGTGRSARVLGMLEITLGNKAEPLVYSYLNKEHFEDRVRYDLVPEGTLLAEASAVALRAYRALGCRDAGRVDLKDDAGGRLQFVEINPLAGLNPSRSDLPILCRKAGIPYGDLIGAIIESAAERAGAGSLKVPGACAPAEG
ncbi:MAG: hypothetical protein JSU90_03545 [Nitrospiraceae bacterium]|nr:MAG: hypothetical protein JSU90_03545 [Nitrospiraceae bacterium]